MGRHKTGGSPSSLRNQTYLHITVQPQWGSALTAMVQPGQRSKLIRQLVHDDIQNSLTTGHGLADRRLRFYSRINGRRGQNHQRICLRVSYEWRAVVLGRAHILGFTIEEYLLALIAREWHRRTLRLAPEPPRQRVGQ